MEPVMNDVPLCKALYFRKDLREVLGCSASTLARLEKQGAIPAPGRLGARAVWSAQAVAALLEKIAIAV